jgi:putative ABC transport system substrate-binding protein
MPTPLSGGASASIRHRGRGVLHLRIELRRLAAIEHSMVADHPHVAVAQQSRAVPSCAIVFGARAGSCVLSMRRREFISLLGGAAAWPVSARAQQLSGRAIIGFLSSGSPRPFAPFVAAFREGMRKLDCIEGRDVSVIYVWAEGHYNELDALAADLVRRAIRLIVASGGVVSARAAMKATATIPILFVVGFDPVTLGLVSSLNRPDGNATGASLFTTELLPKRLDILYELASRTQIAGVLANPNAVTADLDATMIMETARQKGYRVRLFQASTEQEIAAAFVSAQQQMVSALLVTADPFFTTRRAQIVALAARQAMPVIYPWRQYVDAGGLMSYGAELTWGYDLVGQYAARILKGETPSDLPIQQPRKYQLVINLKTAKALGVVVPWTLLTVADEVIE